MNIKKFIGEYAYNVIKNIAVDAEAIRKALITPQNARNVFSELDEYNIKSLCNEISNSGTIGTVKNATQEEITDAFKLIGYDTVIFDDETKISECKKYYEEYETICTCRGLSDRMNEYHMLVAVKQNIDNIKRSENPQRDDEYGTSILNIQIAKNGSHMSIKNRYNHTVSQPDSTLNNSLDNIYNGLQSMVLGYYGFASLYNNKSSYSNIVSINNTYLKYHTKRNNIYFGSFTLDGVNGARFTDTSRYFVTTDSLNQSLHTTPLILDFQAKKAIDVTEHNNIKNAKALILSNAMEKGILTSTNKERANTLIYTLENAKKELLKCNKNSLKFIHEAYGYDFTKPYKVTAFCGKFTAKIIEKTTGSANGIILMWSKNTLNICEMHNGKFVAKDIKGNAHYNINIFYRNCDFEDNRKNGNSPIYVIQQDKQYIMELKYKQSKIRYGLYGNGNHEFDKSGCNLTESRFNLFNRLYKYKKEKQAKQASEVDYTKDITSITEMFSKIKTNLIEKMTNAETYEDYVILTNVINYRLPLLVKDMKNLQEKSISKTFSSIQSAQDEIKDIKNRMFKFTEILSN